MGESTLSEKQWMATVNKLAQRTVRESLTNCVIFSVHSQFALYCERKFKGRKDNWIREFGNFIKEAQPVSQEV